MPALTAEQKLTGQQALYTLYAFVYAVACMFVVCLSNSTADRVNANSLNAPAADRLRLRDPLMDATNGAFTASPIPATLPDKLLGVAAISILLRLITMPTVLGGFVVTRRLLYILASTYMLRAATIQLTVLPNPLRQCVSRPDPDLLADTLKLFTMQRVSCGDVFFSGHTILFTVSASVWHTYSRNRYLRALFSVMAAVGMLSLIVSAYHYTIDVVVGLWVTVTVWSLYHWSLSIPALRRTWWGRLICFVDGAPGMVGELHRGSSFKGAGKGTDIDIAAIFDDYEISQMEMGGDSGGRTRSPSVHSYRTAPLTELELADRHTLA